MTKYLFKKKNGLSTKIIAKRIGISFFSFGIILLLYIFLPLILWQIYLIPAFASNNITSPIPKRSLVTNITLKDLVSSGLNNLNSNNYSDAQNWFPNYLAKKGQPRVPLYKLSIPKLGIENAMVSTQDNDLSIHLVNFSGTAIPPEKGTAIIIGHSTLPQLFDTKNYKTIFANTYTLTYGDKIIATVENISYNYTIFEIDVVNADDNSIFIQNYQDSYLTLVTCTPPGTTWKRLLIKARLTTI